MVYNCGFSEWQLHLVALTILIIITETIVTWPLSDNRVQVYPHCITVQQAYIKSQRTITGIKNFSPLQPEQKVNFKYKLDTCAKE